MIKQFLGLFTLAVMAFSFVLTSVASAAPSKPAAVPTGNDISYPQCNRQYPKGQAFGIVGVNGGKATNTNPCLASQLRWAATSSSAVPNQDDVQVYVNTGNPGQVLEQYEVTTWPTSNIDPRNRTTLGNENPLLNNPYGECKRTEGNYNGYTNDMACSWQYGWNRSVETLEYFKSAAAQAGLATTDPANYVFWLDVETMNSWQGEYEAETTSDLADKRARNTATLEGMKQFYDSEGAKQVGIYSTGLQWREITGTTVEAGEVGQNLRGLDSWLAGAANLADAQKRCNNPAYPSLTPGGRVVLNQYISKNLDYDFSCI